MSIANAAPAAAWPSWRTLLVRQIRGQLTQFVRIPVALFFTILMPLGMLLLFNSIFAGNAATVEGPDGEWPLQQFYVGSLAAFTAVSGTFTNLANMIPDRRENGIMKRWRGTPLPRWAYIGGFVGSGIVVALGGLLIMLGVGVALYDTQVDAAKLPAAAVTFVIGTGAFAALGAAVGGLIRKPDAAPAVANGIILPLAFVSNTFIASDESAMPTWLDVVSNIFPLRPFVDSMQRAFNPTVDSPAFNWSNLGVLAAWGVVGAVLAWRCFKWEPVAGDGSSAPRSRPRRGRAKSSGE